jgi:hypothetical protein
VRGEGQRKRAGQGRLYRAGLVCFDRITKHGPLLHSCGSNPVCRLHQWNHTCNIQHEHAQSHAVLNNTRTGVADSRCKKLDKPWMGRSPSPPLRHP